MVGFLLVAASAGLIVAVLVRDLRAEGRRWRRYGSRDVACAGVDPYAVPLVGLLALVAMMVHSLGDFNLQMPATGWVLAAMVAISIAGGEGLSSVAPALCAGNAVQSAAVTRRKQNQSPEAKAE